MMEEIIQAIKKTKTEIGNKEVECEWSDFLLSEILSIEDISGKELTSKTEKGNIPLIIAKQNNNGVGKFIKNGNKLYSGNKIVLVKTGDGGAGLSFYQKNDFYCTSTIMILKEAIKYNYNINSNIGLFLITQMKCYKNMFSHSNSINENKFYKLKINLPINNNQPDFEMMEKIIDNLKKQSKLDKIEKLKEKLKNDIRQLDTSNWEEVILTNEGAGKEIILKLKNGNVNLVSSTENNNGVVKKVGGYKKLFDGNKLTLAKNGSVGCVFYQAEPFCATSDVVVLSHPQLTKNSALFIKTILEKQTKNFDYNNKINNTKLNKIMLKLPSFEFMEKFIDEIRI